MCLVVEYYMCILEEGRNFLCVQATQVNKALSDSDQGSLHSSCASVIQCHNVTKYHTPNPQWYFCANHYGYGK